MVVTLEMLQLITDAVKNQPAVIPDVVRLERKPMAVTVSRDGDTYANPRVTLDLDDKVGLGRRIEYAKFTPVEKAGIIVARRAELGEDGAVALNRSRSRRTLTFNLAHVLTGFRLDFGNRPTVRCTFACAEVKGDNGTSEWVGVIQVKNPRRKGGGTRGKAKPAPAEPMLEPEAQ